jgi:hypothetical protein
MLRLLDATCVGGCALGVEVHVRGDPLAAVLGSHVHLSDLPRPGVPFHPSDLCVPGLGDYLVPVHEVLGRDEVKLAAGLHQ